MPVINRRWSPWSELFSDALRALLDGTPFGQVMPPAPAPPLSEVDGRTHALRALRDYIAEIVFRIPDPDAPNGKKERQLEHTRILLEWPDNPDALLFPRIEFNPGEGEYVPFGLTPAVFEQSRDVFAPGTVLTCSEEHKEPLELRVFATTRQQRRAIVAGLEQMLSPMEEVSGLRFFMPKYFNETVTFQPLRRTNRDDEDSARRRRRADIVLEMRFNVVRLVRYAPLAPTGAQVEVAVVEGAQLPRTPGMTNAEQPPT